MGLHGHTRNGTGAGWRKPFEAQPRPWSCKCIALVEDPSAPGDYAIAPKINIGALVRCTDCGTWRSEGMPT